MNTETFYVYWFLRDDDTPYYVGKGTGNRAYQRRKKGVKPPRDKSKILIVNEKLTEDAAFVMERFWIKTFGRKDLGTGILLNRTDGGDGCSGQSLTTEYR